MNTISANLWNEELLEAFGNLINKEGWLTSDWATFLEENFKDWDENGNNTYKKMGLFQLMYSLDFEESEDGNLIRPIEQIHPHSILPKRLFEIGEEILHKKYGPGKVKEVLDYRIIITFDSGKELKFVTYLFESNLI